MGSELAALVEMVPRADHLLIENLAVASVFQGQGHGCALLVHVDRVAASVGLAVVRLYRWVGYRVAREEAFRGGVVVHLGKAV